MRTILHFFAGFLLLLPLAVCEEKDTATPTKEVLGEAWLGLAVSKPDDTTTTQLPMLPPGIGFVVTALDENGPARESGMEELDLLWKMNEQMLVNEGQLLTLLRLSTPGDKVTVSVFREGKSLDLKVTLGECKPEDGAAANRILNEAVMRYDDGTLRIVNLEEKKAVLSNENGSAEVSRVDRGDSVRIVDNEGKTIFEAVVKGRPELSDVPQEWRRQISAMRRGLDHALSAKAAPMRQPRPRIVPPVQPVPLVRPEEKRGE